MAKQNTNTGVWIFAGLLLLAGGTFLVLNRKQKETQNENKAIEDIGSSEEAAQAAALYKYLGVTNTGGVYSAWAISNDKYGVYNTCLAVTNIAGVAQKFAQLCNNKFSLNDAMTGGLYDSEYKIAMQYLRAKKVITTSDATPITVHPTGGYSDVIKYFPKNVILGALTSTEGNNYNLVNEVTANGTITATVSVNNAKLITP